MTTALMSDTPPWEGADDLERWLEPFDAAWRAGPPPRIDAFLPPAGAARRAVLEELVRIDLEYRWRRAPGGPTPTFGPPPGTALPERPRLEDYVACLPELGPLEQLPPELIADEYWVRQRWGDRPTHAEYEARFAQYGSRLRALLLQTDAELAAERGRQSPPPPRAAPLLCPHCHHPLERTTEAGPGECRCPACGGAFRVEAPAPAPAAAEAPPFAQVGRYRLDALLGTGAFGTVWSARDTELDREVAVKLPRGGQWAGPADEERFLREARSAAQLQHPHIVTVHDVGRDAHTVYLVADLVRGVSLAEWLKEGRLDFRQAAALTAHVAEALAYAHRQGVVHRDLKPSNILLEEVGGTAEGVASWAPKITDFGLAKREAGEVTLTVEGQVLGTPAYMSPEQVRDPHAVDGRSDLYSLGVILYQLLTGELPFRGVTRMLLEQVQHDEPRPPRRLNDKIPRDLETITLKCLAKEPERRYPTADALAADLRRWLAGEPIQARPVGRAERLRRWGRRRPAAAALLGLTLLVAFVGFPGVTWLWLFAERHRATAETLRAEAQAEALRSDERRRRAEQQLEDTHQAIQQVFTMEDETTLSREPLSREAQQQFEQSQLPRNSL